MPGKSDRLLDKNLDAIAITDHNTANWIDRVKIAADSTDLKVFPGTEITASGGEGGIHIIAIFDPEKNEGAVNDLLAKADITSEMRGDKEAISPQSVNNIVELIYNCDALPILAHANSSKGVLSDIRGQQRNKIMNNPRVASVEVNDTETYRPMLDGNDQNYKRALPVHRASDNPATGENGHSLDGIASQYSFFKMDEVNLNGLRQCFYDPEIRIRTDEDISPFSESVGPYIKNISVSQGFLSGSYHFHEGLNCIVGGKGVGKSLLVEAIRFGLNQESELEQISKDHKSKLKKRFGLGCSVEIQVVSKSGQEFKITRVYNGETNPTNVLRPSNNSDYDGEIDELFPIMAYSQTEAVEIARDETAQLSLVDRLLDLTSLFRELRKIQEKLNTLGQNLANCISEDEKCDQFKTEIASVEERITEIDRQLGSGEHVTYNQMLTKKDYLDEHTQQLNEWKKSLREEKEKIDSDDLPDLPEKLEDDTLSNNFNDLSFTNKEEIKTSLQESIGLIKTRIMELQNLREDWDDELENAKERYEEWAEQAGGDAPSLTQKREELVLELKDLKESLSNSQSIANNASDYKVKRDEQLDKLEGVRNRIFELRSTKYEEITEATEGRLHLSLIKNGNGKGLKND